jgi:hypothetical protein
MSEDIYSLAFCCQVKNDIIEEFFNTKKGKIREKKPPQTIDEENQTAHHHSSTFAINQE